SAGARAEVSVKPSSAPPRRQRTPEISPVGSLGIRRSVPVVELITRSTLTPSSLVTQAIERPSGDKSNSSTSQGMPFVRTRYRRVARSTYARRWNSEPRSVVRSEEHTSELQSRFDLVCRLLLEKKKDARGTEAW